MLIMFLWPKQWKHWPQMWADRVAQVELGRAGKGDAKVVLTEADRVVVRVEATLVARADLTEALPLLAALMPEELVEAALAAKAVVLADLPGAVEVGEEEVLGVDLAEAGHNGTWLFLWLPPRRR